MKISIATPFRNLFWIAFLCVLFINAGPPPQKASVDLAVGGGALVADGGCHNPDYRTRQGRVSGKATYRSASGGTVSGEIGTSARRTIDADVDEDAPEGIELYLHPSAGWHWKYGGIDVGLLLVTGDGQGPGPWFDEGTAVPTGHGWVGTPDFHLYTTLIDTSASSSSLLSWAWGVGHKSQSFRANGGLRIIPEVEAPIVGHLAMQGRLTEKLWLGGSLEFAERHSHIAATLGLNF